MATLGKLDQITKGLHDHPSMKRFILLILVLVLLGVGTTTVYVGTRSDEDIARWLAAKLSEELGRPVRISGPASIEWSTAPS